MDSAPDSIKAMPPWSRKQVLIPALIIVLATFALHAPRLIWTSMIYDDLGIVTESWPWEVTWKNLWRPANEHSMPLGRITTALMVDLAGNQSNIPRVLSLQGPIALLLCMGLLYLFVRREMAHPFYGLIAMGIFGITTQYVRAVSWFAASFAMLSLLFTLLALLAAQRHLQKGSWLALALCGLWCFLSPGWFAIGVLTGPLCSLYFFLCSDLLPNTIARAQSRMAETHPPWLGCAGIYIKEFLRSSLRRAYLLLIPVTCTGLFFLISLKQNADLIMNLPHYGEKTAVEAFDLNEGLFRTYRSLVDHKLLGTLGVPGFGVPISIFPLLLMVMACSLFYWYRIAPRPSLILLGMAFILCSDVMIQSARAEWHYENLVVHWTRYQLYPHLGVTLIILAGLPRWQNQWLKNNPTTFQSRSWIWLSLVALLVLCHMPRGWPFEYRPDQPDLLRKIEQIDQRARDHHISREQALKALQETGKEPDFPTAMNNGWLLLRGSDSPRPVENEKVRQLLLDGIDIPLREPLRLP